MWNLDFYPAHVQVIKQSSVVVIVVVVVHMKIAGSGDLGICTLCNHDKSVDIGEKLGPARLNLPKMAYYSTTYLFSMPVVYRPHPLYKHVMRLRMLKLSAGKGGQVITSL